VGEADRYRSPTRSVAHCPWLTGLPRDPVLGFAGPARCGRGDDLIVARLCRPAQSRREFVPLRLLTSRAHVEEVSVPRTSMAAVVIAVLAAIDAVASGHVAIAPAQSVAERLVGHWRLVSCEAVTDGRVEHPYGQDAVGQIAYDSAGHVAVQIMRRDRKQFASGDIGVATPDELSAAFVGYVAYFGSYSVDESAGVVTHHLDASWFPNWVGSEQRRFFALEGDRLTLTTPPIQSQGGKSVFRLVWQRLE
jgi:lipocalin-like protein